MPRGWAAAPAQQPTQQHQPPAPQHQLHTLPAQSPFQNSQQYGARHEQDAEVAAVQQNAQGYGPTGQWSGSQMQPEEQHIGPLDTESYVVTVVDHVLHLEPNVSLSAKATRRTTV